MNLNKEQYLENLKTRAAKNLDAGVKFEFQEVGKEVQAYFHKNLWWVFFKPWCSETKARRALEICKTKNNLNSSYFIGIIKKL